MAAEIRILVNSQSSGAGITQAKKDIQDLGKTAKESGGGFSAMREIATGALREIGSLAVGAAMGGVHALVGVIGDSIDAARESNKVMAQTAAVIKSTGGAAGVSAEHVADYASSLSAAAGKSLFGDEQIAESTNMLLTFTNIKGKVLDAATAISVDMAQALGGSPKDNAIQLGKALNDPIKGITALTRVGVTFSQDQKDMIQAMVDTGHTAEAQQVILAELNKEFGGSAEAAAKADGGFAQFKDRLGEMEETIGKAVMPILNELMGFLNSSVLPVVENVVQWFSAWADSGDPLNDFFANLPGPLQEVVRIIESLVLGVRNLSLVFQNLGFEGLFTVVEDGTSAFSSFLEQLGLTEGAALAVNNAIQSLVGWLQGALPQAIDFINAHWEEFKGALIAIGVLLAGAAIVGAIASLAATIAALANPITLIIGAVALLGAAWAGDWGGIQEKTTAVWAFLEPIFSAIVLWLQTNIPVAVQAVSDFWNNTLLPALTAVWGFITNNVIPTFTSMATGTFTTVTTATQSVADFWNNILKPALNAVWTFLNTYVIPLFTALANVTIALVKLEVRALAALWTGVLQPALNAVWDFVTKNLTPTLTWLNDQVLKPAKEAINALAFAIMGAAVPQLGALANAIKTAAAPALNTLQGVADDVKGAINSIGDAVKSVISWLGSLASKIDSISIPNWLQGHSPPPMANWLSAIGQAARFASQQMNPMLRIASTAPMVASGAQYAAGAAATGVQTYNTRNFSYNPTIYTNAPANDLDGALYASLAGV